MSGASMILNSYRCWMGCSKEISFGSPVRTLKMAAVGELLKNATEQQPQPPVWITHMWQRRIEHSRLGLVLGSGVSHDADIPMWGELVERLMVAANFPSDRMAAHKNDDVTPALLAEMAYRRHFINETDVHSAMPAKFR